MLAAGGAVRLEPPGDMAPDATGGVAWDPAGALAEAASAVLSNLDLGQALAGAAAAVAAEQAELPERIAAALLPLLPGLDRTEGRVTVEA